MPPSMRADARRNRERILDAAMEAFAEEGGLVPLDEIARRAGVGAGTVYRHFATKEALFQAVVAGRLEWIVEEGRALAAAADPGAAFFGYLAAVVERAMFNHALCEALAATGDDRDLPVAHVDGEFTGVIAGLLERAQSAGAVRRDVDAADVRALLTGCLVMERQRRTAGEPGRMTALVCASLQPTVTKLSSAIRNETDREAACAVCGGPIATARTGRPAKYCGPACRQKAHRRRESG